MNEQMDHPERSSLKLYLQEIGRTPLLKPEQEVQLSVDQHFKVYHLKREIDGERVNGKDSTVSFLC